MGDLDHRRRIAESRPITMSRGRRPGRYQWQKFAIGCPATIIRGPLDWLRRSAPLAQLTLGANLRPQGAALVFWPGSRRARRGYRIPALEIGSPDQRTGALTTLDGSGTAIGASGSGAGRLRSGWLRRPQTQKWLAPALWAQEWWAPSLQPQEWLAPSLLAREWLAPAL